MTSEVLTAEMAGAGELLKLSTASVENETAIYSTFDKVSHSTAPSTR
jgi:hypothetical protein